MTDPQTDTQRKKKAKNRHPPPKFSIGNKEKKLLQYLSKNKGERFNIKNYSRISNVPRSSVYDMLERLIKKGLALKEPNYKGANTGNHTITNNGITTLELLKGGVGTSRTQCRKGQLSTHYLRYKLPISDKSNFSKPRIKELNPLKQKSIKWNKEKIHYAYFEDGTIIIHPKSISIRIHEIIAEDTEEAQFKAFNKAMEYMHKLSKIGLKTASIELEPAHYARVESYLADFLQTVDKRYFLDLGDGKKFWIDTSPPNKIEDETNDMQIRERVDQFMEDMINSDVLLSDIDKIVKALGFVSKIECARFKREIKPLNEITPEERPSYFG